MDPIDVEKVLSELTLTDKVALLSGTSHPNSATSNGGPNNLVGVDYWHTHAILDHGVPALRFTDGPNGARGTRNFNSVPAAAFPCGTALGATFNQILLKDAGELMGREAIAKGAHVLLGPCINMQRSPLGGRGFESISEDPVLAGLAAASIINGIESTGEVACIKHFVCNDQEHQRTRYNAIVTQRALREIYLKPFQIAQRDAQPSAYMTAYNKLNGVHVSENPFLIQHILRGEWGFTGLVMSDWFGTYSTAEAASAGLDIEMPGPTRWRSTLLVHSVDSGKIPETVVNDRARAVLNLVNRCTESKVPSGAPEGKLDTPATAEQLRKIATESIVLLKNDQKILPLHKGKSTLLVGPHATNAIFSGGGSSALTPYTAVSPHTGIKNILPSTTPLHTVLGTYTHKELPLLGPYLTSDDGVAGFDFRVYASPPGTPNRELAEHIRLTDSHMLLQDFSSPRITSPLWYATMTGSFVPEESGRYDFGLCVYGTANLYVDDELLIDNTTYQRPGTAFYGTGTVEEISSVHMQAGRKYKVRVQFASAPTNTLNGGGVVRFGGGGLRVGVARQIDADDEIGKAIAAAKEAEQVVIITALGPDWEGEGHDRENMKLPGRMDELIYAVASTNQNTTVVLQTGMPIEMPWADSVNSIVQAWYLGNEAGNAIADVLFGNESPSGKLSVSFPRALQDNPAYLNYRCEGGRTLYGEDVYVGYRWYDAVQREALFPFGHGLGYSTFTLSDLKVIKNGKDEVVISVLLANLGHVPAKEVLQVYVTPADQSAVRRPPKELQGFTKEHFEVGEKRTVSVKVHSKYAAGYWDESREMWRCEKGRYGVVVCTSTTGKMLSGAFEVDEEFWWTGL